MHLSAKSLIAVAVMASFGFNTANAADPAHGLTAEYFALDTSPEDFPVIAPGTKPKLTRVDEQINFDSTDGEFAKTGLTTSFYVRWNGSIQVEKDGKYTFTTESDDGSRLLIDGKAVVNNGGNHGMEEQSGEVELKAGSHTILIELYQGEGEVGCKAYWAADGLPKQIIPSSALTPAAAK